MNGKIQSRKFVGSCSDIHLIEDEISHKKIIVKKYENDEIYNTIFDRYNKNLLYKDINEFAIFPIFFDKEKRETYLNFIEGHDLYYHVINYDLELEDVKVIFIKILLILNCFHKKGIIHGDIKLENIIIDYDDNIYIIDWDHISQMDENKKVDLNSGTPSYCPPEMLIRKETKIGYAIDVWSCGVVLYNLLCKMQPYDNYKNMKFNYKGQLLFIYQTEYNKIEIYKKILINIFQFEPYRRPQIDDILKILI